MNGTAPDITPMLLRDHKRMRQAGCALAEAAIRVVNTHDGIHRLSAAVAGWARAIADEGDRGDSKASAAAPEPLEIMGNVIPPDEIERTKRDLDEDATAEVLVMATLFRMLSEDTMLYSRSLHAEGFTLKAEEANQRAGRYNNCYRAICAEWND